MPLLPKVPITLAFPSGEGGLTRRLAEVKTDEEKNFFIYSFLLIHRLRGPLDVCEANSTKLAYAPTLGKARFDAA